MPLIPEPSASESVAVGAAAVAFPTVLEAGTYYELASDTACWIARAEAVAFADANFIADNATDSITFDAPHGLTSGDGPFQLTCTAVADVLPAPLAAGTDYWAIRLDNDTFKLATSVYNALAGTAINLTTVGIGTHTLVDTAATTRVNLYPLVYADLTVTPTFADNKLTAGGAHFLTVGDGPFQLTCTAAFPAGLAALTDYWIIEDGATTFKLAASFALARAGTAIDFSDNGGGVLKLVDTATTIDVSPLVYADKAFTAAVTDICTATAHGLVTGDGPLRVTNSGITDSLPTPLAVATDYWAIVVDADTVKLATTYANALAPTPINLTDDGRGTHTMVDTTATIAAGTGAVVGGAGSMYVAANGPPTQFAGAYTVDGTVRTKLSVIRATADGRASLTPLVAV